MKKSATKVEYNHRKVIEDQLLTALDDKRKVAILATAEDLDLLILALDEVRYHAKDLEQKRKRYLDDLKMLRDKAFNGGQVD